MKLMKILVTATVVTCLPVVIGGQAMLDLGDHGAAFAKNEGKGNSDKGNSDKGNSDKGRSEKGSSDRGGKSEKSSGAKTSKSSSKSGSGKSASKSGAKGNNPFTAIKNAFGKKKTGPKTVRKKEKVVSSSQKTVRKNSVKTAKLAVAGGSLHSQLKGLNSLNRNINGMINGKDAKMDPIRDFIVASAEFEAAKDALKEAGRTLEAVRDTFAATVAELGIEASDAQTMLDQYNGMIADHAAAMPEQPQAPEAPEAGVENYDALVDQYKVDYAQWEKDYAAWETSYSEWDARGQELKAAAELASAVETALGDYDAAAKTLVDSVEPASTEALQQAMADALNATGAGPLGPEDMTPEMVDWAAAQLGVGEAEGLIDDYIARQPTQEASAEGGDGSGSDDPEDDVDEAEAKIPEEEQEMAAAQ
ncbi:hypothetical protein [Aliiruegeria lutimaris]|uniref:Uncharacterized protein n=1 Tax=Aliiruegeria lutimaris TaxID=571298 RepID=A0A1G8IPS5_9RHOB|nr:hypothetical protein [Aliiruegeria lutimaris]SDI20925.1 hypothetical protein SAMN04488026_100195 [Aliiruegeria lutimaris]